MMHVKVNVTVIANNDDDKAKLDKYQGWASKSYHKDGEETWYHFEELYDREMVHTIPFIGMAIHSALKGGEKIV